MKMFDKFLNLFKPESNEVRYDATITIDKSSFEQLNQIAVHRGVKAEKEAMLFWKIGSFFERACVKSEFEMEIKFKDSNGREKTVGYEELVQHLLNSK